MANTQSRFGFQQFGYLSGGQPDYQQSSYRIQSTCLTAIFAGDPVTKSAALGQYILPSVGTATAITGIFVGCQYTPAGGTIPVWSPAFPGGTTIGDAVAYVIDAPNALFRVAALNTAIPATAIGQNIAFTTGGVTATTFGAGLSIVTVDQATLTTNSAYPFQIYSMFPGVGNGSDTTTAYNWVIVSFNNQRIRSTTGV